MKGLLFKCLFWISFVHQSEYITQYLNKVLQKIAQLTIIKINNY